MTLIKRNRPHSLKNPFWPGHFGTWQAGHAYAVLDHRAYANCDGWTLARAGFVTGVTLYHVDGKHEANAARIQRTPANASTASAYLTAMLLHRETRGMQGKTHTFAIRGMKSATYSGGNPTLRIHYSEEPEQVITNDDGTFTNGNVLLASLALPLTTVMRDRDDPWFVTVTIPESAVQIAVALEVPWAGVAGDDDWVTFEALHAPEATRYVRCDEPDHDELMQHARSRYASSYPYGFPRGIATLTGSVSDIARSTAANWAVVLNPRFPQDMPITPTAYFWATNSGKDFELHNHAGNTDDNAMAYDLGRSGFTVTNNQIAVDNTRYSAQWSAVL
jgi:hypothetical protein